MILLGNNYEAPGDAWWAANENGACAEYLEDGRFSVEVSGDGLKTKEKFRD